MRRFIPAWGIALTFAALLILTGVLSTSGAHAQPAASGPAAPAGGQRSAPGGAATPTPTASTTAVACTTAVVATGAITNTDPTQNGRLFRGATPSSCGAPNAAQSIAGTYHYDLYQFNNPSSASACIVVTLDTACTGANFIFSGAYLNSFDPANIIANNIGDSGSSPDVGMPAVYSFTVPANTTFFVNVHEVSAGGGCSAYTLTVADIPCPLPTATATATETPTATATQTATSVPTATATPVNCPLPFTDVDQFNPFYQYIQCLYCRGIISGYSDNTFRWTADVTRGQVSKIIANAAGLNGAVSGQTFTDVPPGNPFYVFIERLAATGAISGYNTAANCPSGVPCFRWELPVTRGQLSKIDANAAGYNETPSGQTFRDVPAANPFYVFIERLSLHGVISGYTCGGPGEPCPGLYFRPNANITRGQVSKVASQTFFPNACAPGAPPTATVTR